MATQPRPAHGSSAQTTEFAVDLVGHGIDRHDAPTAVEVTISADASGALSLEVATPAAFDNWRLDVRVSRGNLDIREAFRAGKRVRFDAVPEWMDVVLQQANARLLEGN